MGPKTTLRNIIMELKKCSNHPSQFEKVEDITVETTVGTFNRISGAESPRAKRLKRNTRGSKNSDAMHWRVVKERGENVSSKLGEVFGPISCARHSSMCRWFRSIGGANSK
jgi:hypothetical protein